MPIEGGGQDGGLSLYFSRCSPAVAGRAPAWSIPTTPRGLIATRSQRRSRCWSKRRIGPTGPNGRYRKPRMGGKSSPGEWSVPNAKGLIDTCLGAILSSSWMAAWWPFIIIEGDDGRKSVFGGVLRVGVR